MGHGEQEPRWKQHLFWDGEELQEKGSEERQRYAEDSSLQAIKLSFGGDNACVPLLGA